MFIKLKNILGYIIYSIILIILLTIYLLQQNPNYKLSQKETIEQQTEQVISQENNNKKIIRKFL